MGWQSGTTTAYSSVQNAGVQYILDTVIQQLLLNPERKFIYVEIAYFKRWWDEQNADLKQQVAILVNSGKIMTIAKLNVKFNENYQYLF